MSFFRAYKDIIGIILIAIAGVAICGFLGYQKVLMYAAGCTASPLFTYFCDWYVFLAENPVMYALVMAGTLAVGLAISL